jgi:uncharacterized membrane protein
MRVGHGKQHVTLAQLTEVVRKQKAGADEALLVPASIGAVAALLCVVLLGIVVHKPLTAIPENALKFCVGVLLSAFGAFWVGEGVGLNWPGQDWSLLILTAGFLLVALLSVRICRNRAARVSLPAEVRR